ncbi:MAG TPA: LysM peptidoglycan-binding domain-containing protein [Pseudonocardiaceae bacterium]|nr:LysM peptidoglycan-binding domain-containing protein [Pseudonocardiaceae bacterium]
MTAPARTLIIVHPQRSERVPGIGLDRPRPARVRAYCPGRPAPGPTSGSGPGWPTQLRRPPVVPYGSAPPDRLPDREESACRRAVRVMTAGVVTLSVVCGLAVLGQVAADGPAVPATTTVVQVGAGETLWDVARRIAPDTATPAVVQHIRELNGMVGSELRPGQQLTVPMVAEPRQAVQGWDPDGIR